MKTRMASFVIAAVVAMLLPAIGGLSAKEKNPSPRDGGTRVFDGEKIELGGTFVPVPIQNIVIRGYFVLVYGYQDNFFGLFLTRNDSLLITGHCLGETPAVAVLDMRRWDVLWPGPFYIATTAGRGESFYIPENVVYSSAAMMVKTKNIQIAEFTLAQNFPNPFNPTTNISFQLPEATHVTLKVYNTLGQEVAMLVDGIVEAGYHSATWNAASLPSGIYFSQLKSGGFVRMMRMRLTR